MSSSSLDNIDSWSTFHARTTRTSDQSSLQDPNNTTTVPKDDSIPSSSTERTPTTTSGSLLTYQQDLSEILLTNDDQPIIETLSLQPMIPHPSTLFSLLSHLPKDQQQEEDPLMMQAAQQSAEFYDKAREAQQRVGSKEQTKPPSSSSRPQVTQESSGEDYIAKWGLPLPTVAIDLTLLVDPPLVSEWVPGVRTCIDYPSEKEEEEEDGDRVMMYERSSGETRDYNEDLNSCLDFPAQWNEWIIQLIWNRWNNMTIKDHDSANDSENVAC